MVIDKPKWGDYNEITGARWRYAETVVYQDANAPKVEKLARKKIQPVIELFKKIKRKLFDFIEVCTYNELEVTINGRSDPNRQKY